MEKPDTTRDKSKELFIPPENWDMKTLYTDLASIKGKNLTPIEKRHLCALLCGHSPAEIAEKLERNLNGLEVDLSNTVYQYVKRLVDRENEKIKNWRNICQWLEEAGYKTQQTTQSQSTQSVPIDAKVHISSINIENQTIEIGILLQLPLPSPPNSSKEPTQ